MNIWSLPGPSSFVDRIEESIRNVDNVFLRFPIGIPAGLERELRYRLYSVFDWITIDGSYSDDPVSSLREQICPEASTFRAGSMAELAEHRAFQGRLVWIGHMGREEWSRWSDAFVEYAEACRNIELIDRTVLVALLCRNAVGSEAPEAVALVCHDFRNVLDPLDIFALAFWSFASHMGSRERRALKAHTVSQIAQWDCFLAEKLLSLPIEEMWRPERLLGRYAESMGWSGDTPRSWESGTLDGPPGAPIVHSASLVIGGDDRLIRQRVWAAQAAVLLPLVEERRVRLMQLCVRYLSGGDELGARPRLDDLLDLEVGDLVRELGRAGAPGWLRHRVHKLRLVRNKLAHMEPVGSELALDPDLIPDQ